MIKEIIGALKELSGIIDNEEISIKNLMKLNNETLITN